MSLIEVMVALLVVSVGLMAIARMQLKLKHASFQSSQRSVAVMLADDMLERIRANPTAAAAYNLGAATPITPGSTPNSICASAGACTAAELQAQADLRAWATLMTGSVAVVAGNNVGGLIEPLGCVFFTPMTGTATLTGTAAQTGRVSVVVNWRGLDELSDAVQQADTLQCGTGATFTADARRHQVVLSSFVVSPTEFNPP